LKKEDLFSVEKNDFKKENKFDELQDEDYLSSILREKEIIE
jgi:hypothetical protein